MATRIFYNSNPDGTINEQVTSGQVGGFFSALTTQERLDGDTEFAKMWIESDTTETVYVGVDPEDYLSYVFLSANEADDEGDLLGTEDMFTGYEILDSDQNSYIIVNDDGNLRQNDYLIAAGELYQIQAVTDLLDGTYKLEFAQGGEGLYGGDTAYTAFQLNLTANAPKPFWAKSVVPAGTPRYGDYATTSLIIGN